MIVKEPDFVPLDPDLIPKIKASASCLDLFKRFWPSNFRSSGNCRCSWHEDNTASLQVDKERAHCHACGFTYDAIDLYQRGANVEKGEAIRLLAEECNLSTNGNGTSKKRKDNPKHKAPVEFYKIWNKLCKNTFPSEATAYIEETRKIKGLLPDLLKREQIAYDPKFKTKNYKTDEFETWRVVAFPLSNLSNNEMLGIQYISIDGQGKRFAPGTNAGECFFFYGTGNEFCVITGAILDSLSVYAACKNTMELETVSILSEGKGYTKKLSQLNRLNPVLFFDRDQGGIDATNAAVKLLKGKCRLVDWSLAPAPTEQSKMKDVNDLLKAGHAEVIERMVRLSRVPTEEEVEAQDTEADRVNQRLEELNQQYSVVMLGGKCLVMRKIIDPIFDRKDITFSSFNDFRNFYSNEKYWIENGSGKAKKKSVADTWLEQPGRTQFQGIVFNPNKEVPGYYNLWQGFSCEPKEGSCGKLLQHIFYNIAQEDQKIYEYVFAWMADIVQNPGGKRNGVSLVLRGKQGVGKGCLAEYFGKILGSHFIHVTQASQLTGKFNNHLKDALLVFADEAFWAGDKNAEGVLKGMITEDMLMIEPKGRDPFSVRNHVRLLIASNNDWLVPAGPQERRFCVFNVSDKHQQDHKYFSAIWDEMKNGGREALLHLLLKADISNFNFYDFPKTEALLDQKVNSLCSCGKFWFECLRRGSKRLPFRTTMDEKENPYEQEMPWELMISTHELYKIYLSECRDRNDRYPQTDSLFMRKLKELCPPIRRKKATISGGERFWAYNFPGLEECRNAFDEVMKTKVTWGDDL